MEASIPLAEIENWQELIELLSCRVDGSSIVIGRWSPPSLEILCNTGEGAYKKGDEISLEEGIFFAEVISKGKEFKVLNVDEDSHWSQFKEKNNGACSFWGLPIMAPDGVPFGLVALISYKPHIFSSDEERVLNYLKYALESKVRLIELNYRLEKRIEIKRVRFSYYKSLVEMHLKKTTQVIKGLLTTLKEKPSHFDVISSKIHKKLEGLLRAICDEEASSKKSKKKNGYLKSPSLVDKRLMADLPKMGANREKKSTPSTDKASKPRKSSDVETDRIEDGKKRIKVIPMPQKNGFVQGEYVKCSKCGKKNRKGAKFCNSCGENLIEARKKFINKGKDQLMMRNTLKALEYFDKVLSMDPKDVEVLYLKGDALVNMRETDKALEIFNKILDIDPENYPALYKKGKIFLSMGKPHEAIQCFDTILKKNPEDTEVLSSRKLAMSLLQTKGSKWVRRGGLKS